jgi:hypothetical protein
MDRNLVKQMMPIIQAYAEGKIIECRTKPSTIKGTDVPNDWTEIKDISFWDNIEYRIKPESKYRPFKDAEECWQEVLKHQPFGWVKLKDTESGYYLLKGIASQVVIGFNENPFSYKKVFEDYTFANGTPFGAKIEEE